MVQAKKTTNRQEIKQWVEKRGGKPAKVKGTGNKSDPGMLRISFKKSGPLQEIGWDEFFEKFDESKLAFLCQEKTPLGKPSRFFKFVRR